MAAVGSPLNLRNQIPIHPLQSSTPSSSSSSSSLHTLHLFKLPKPPLNPINFTPRKPLRHLPTSLNPNPEPQTAKETQAQQAIEEYLLKMGALSEDASSISLNCPDYVKTLIDGVNDLDEWNSWKGDFKNKVYAMVEEKGDKGVLAFLESLGLSLSSATYLARYLASSSSRSNKLPMLIQKVKYVKDIFFSGSNDGSGEVMGRNARRMMANLSISADEDLQQTLAFLEKIQARRGGLDLLDSECASLPYLIESFPLLLLKSVESRVEPIFKFLEDIGVAKGHMRNILLLYPPILCFDVDKDIKPRLRVYEKVGLRDNDLGKMVVKYPWILSACILENFDKVVDFLDKEKVPRLSSSEAIRNWPQILGCSVDKMKLTVDQFSDIGISNKKLGHIIAKSPQLLLCRHHEFEQMVTFFKGLGLDEEAIARTLKRCPEIFVASIDKTLAKKVEFLSVVGISKSHLPRVIRKYPDLLVCDVDKALRPRVRYFMKIGLTKNQIVSMVRRFSPLLGYSIEGVLKPKVEFLVNKMEKPLRDVVEYPRYFSYSLEKRIKPRYWVMKSRNIEINLKEMLGKNDEEFASDYLDV